MLEEEKPNLTPPASLSMFFRVDDYVYRSSLPNGEIEFDFLQGRGIDSIISFHPLMEKDRELAERRKIRVMDLPLDDGDLPSDDFVGVFFDHVSKEIAAGRTVLLHCMAGQQRTGLMTGLYLVKFHGMHPLQAYWEADKNHLSDYPDYKKFLLEYGQQIFDAESRSQP